MNSDHYYKIGKSHETCQDYAISGAIGSIHYAIVCDGCSSSEHVDFGARVLALSAREIIRIAKSVTLTYENFGIMAIRRADTLSAILPMMHPEFLDATLLIAWIENNKLTALMYGDGVFFHKTGNVIRAVHVEYHIPVKDKGEISIKPMPDYLAYHLDSSRKERYEALGGDKTIDDRLISEGHHSGTPKLVRPFDPVIIQAPVEKGDVIALCSDGINSFRSGDGTAIPWHSLVNDFMGFKNFNEVFVKRRMTAFDRNCQKEQITHLDDISVAAIVV